MNFFLSMLKKNKMQDVLRSYSIPNLELGTRYLNQMVRDGVEYNVEILNSIADNSIDGLYIPRNLILPALDSNESMSKKEFFLDSIYWLRYLRSEKIRLDDLTWIDLYLVGSNPFERYSARKLLSYYNDKELYLKFGKIGKFLFPKTYSSKRTQLDGIVAFCLQPFGYFTVLNWSRPIKLEYHSSVVPLESEKIQNFELSDLTLNFGLSLDQESPKFMPLLRLGIQIEACWPLITDKEAWMPFIDMINSNSHLLHEEYKKGLSFPSEEKKKRVTVILSDNFESYEQIYNTCLLCLHNRPLGDFSLCGHGTCMTCQSLLGTAKCPFCTEHFTADNLNDEYVKILQSDLGNSSKLLLQDKIRQMTALKSDRSFKFDWSNVDVTIFS